MVHETTDEKLVEVYQQINQVHWDGKLPAIPVMFGKLPKRAVGHTKFLKIKGKRGYFPVSIIIDEALKPAKMFIFVYTTLMHEAAHIGGGFKLNCERRGGAWDRLIDRLFAAGAYRGML